MVASSVQKEWSMVEVYLLAPVFLQFYPIIKTFLYCVTLFIGHNV